MMFVEVMLLLILLGANCTQAHIKYCSFVVWCCVLFFFCLVTSAKAGGVM